jgi:aminopeptidase N
VYERIEKSLVLIQNYFGVDFPLKKLDIVALPGFSTVKPVDNWGLVVYK